MNSTATTTGSTALSDRIQKMQQDAWASYSEKDRDRKEFRRPLEAFARVLDYMVYMYTASGRPLLGDGLRRYAERTCFLNFSMPFGKTPGQLRTRVVNLLGAHVEPSEETDKDDYVTALEIFLHSIVHCPKYTVVPDYHFAPRHRTTLRETETWLCEASVVTGAAPVIDAYFKGVPREDILPDDFAGLSHITSNFAFHRYRPDWEDDECQDKFIAGIDALQKQGKVWDGTNIDF